MTTSDNVRVAVIIEDDADTRSLLDTVLTQSGFTTVLASNGHEGVELVRKHNPLLTTLDVSMPGMDGLATAKRIREFSSGYLIMVSALGDEIDIVSGLNAGADDYMVKPFRLRELRARVDTVLRRPRAIAGDDAPPAVGHGLAPDATAAPAGQPMPAPSVVSPSVVAPSVAPHPVAGQPVAGQPVPGTVAGEAPAAPDVASPLQPEQEPVAPAGASAPASAPVPAGEPAADWLRFKGIELNSASRVVRVDGAPVELTRSEFNLLESLLESGRRVRSKADLVLMLRGESYVTAHYINEADKRAVEVHVANLRRKIGDSSTTPRWIETVRGVGYRLATAEG